MKKNLLNGNFFPFLQLKKWSETIRITTLFLFISVVSSYAEGTYVQEQTVNMRKNNAMLEEVLNEIEAQTNYLFIYSNEVDIKRAVSVNAENKQITNLLDELFRNTNINYRIDKSHIILFRKNQSVPAPSPAQQRNTVKGKVVDESGETIIGANVYEKNTTNGNITDVDGLFSLELPPNATLVISYIGYLTQEINIRNRQEIEIILQEDTKTLDEVVVVGYGTQRKADLTGAISSIGGEVLEDRPITSVGAGLQGTIPGLNISFANGSPGASATFNVRGTTNFNNSQALILVDGIEMDPGLLNPNDIKEVTVLKDAASAAIYGARAAFGVVLITTKTGFVDRKTTVSLNANYAINAPTVKPKYMNSLEYTQWMNDANLTTNGVNYFDDVAMEHVRAYFYDPENNLPVYHHPNDASSVWRYCGNTDWYKELNKNNYPTQ